MFSKGLVGAVFASALAVGSASAETVTFRTEGGFGSNPIGTPVYTTSGGVTVTFTGASESSDIDPGDFSFEDFGTFGVSGSLSGSFDTTFTLRVIQDVPVGGSGDLEAVLKGKLNFNASTSTLQVLFDPGATLSIGSVTYDPNDATRLKAPVWPASSTLSTLEGEVSVGAVSAVPLPAAAWGGISLLGILGGGKLWKRRREIE